MSGPGLHDVGAPMPRQSIVLLGASNLAGGIATVVDSAQRIFGQPLDVLAAVGYGRSYGIETTVLGRTLPGILDCALWDALREKRHAPPPAALITDIGNDLMYGVPVQLTLSWVETALTRLHETGADVIMTLLPLASVYKLSNWRFRLMRQVLFPSCRYELPQLLPLAEQLHEGLRELGSARGVQLIEHEAAWYGFDPIHIRIRRRKAVWRQILIHWRANPGNLPPTRPSLRRWAYLRTRTPHRRRLFGIEQRAQQPAARLSDGTRISFY